MAKPPPEELFEVTTKHVPQEKLGALMTVLTKMGFSDISFNLVTHVTTFNKRVLHEVKAEDFLAEWLPDHPTFRAKEVVTHFESNGRTAGAAYTALRVMVENGFLKKLGNGNYSRKDVRELAGPKKKAAKPAKKHTTSNATFAVAFAARHGGKLVRADFKEALEKDGRSTAGISSTFRDLLTANKVKRVSEGIYELVAAKTNGGAHAHG